MHGNLVICDDDPVYSQRFSRFLSRHYPEEQNIFVLHSVKELNVFQKGRRIDTLLLSESLYQNERNPHLLPGARKLLLTKESISENRFHPYEPVRRYQRADLISKKLLLYDTYRCFPPENHTADAALPTGLVGFYSPVHRIGQTEHALNMARQCAKDKTVLYLNMRAYPEYNLLPEASVSASGENLGDLLFSPETDPAQFAAEISSISLKLDGVSVLMPIPVLEDLKTVSALRWISLIETLCSIRIFDTVILDLGDCVSGLYQILNKCAHVVTYYTSDRYSLDKLRLYEHNLISMGLEQVLEKSVRHQVSL